MIRFVRWVLGLMQLLLLAGSGGVLLVACRWNETRYRQGPVVAELGGGHGLHEMDVRLIALAGCLWLGIALLGWAKGRNSR